MLRTNLSTRPFYNERVVHLLAALAHADCLLVVPAEVTEVSAGSEVEVWLLETP